MITAIILSTIIRKSDAFALKGFKKAKCLAAASSHLDDAVKPHELSSLRMSSSEVSLKGYGKHVFKGSIAAPYLSKHGLPVNVLDTPTWTMDGSADKVLVRYFISALTDISVRL